MELLQELLVTAVVAVFFSFLIAKLVSVSTSGGDSHSSNTQNVDQEIFGDADDQRIMEDLQYLERLKVQAEKRMGFVEQDEQKVDRFVVESAIEVEKSDDLIETECHELSSKASGESSKEEEDNGLKLAADEILRTTVDDIVVESEEVGVVESEEREKEKGEEKKTEIDVDENEYDDWEGIERSELEHVFAEATKFGHKAGSDVQMELYGLHKVATEGPCRQQPPLALKVAARAKCDGGHCLRCARNAWQRLGNMTPEVAMEQYVALVSDKIPGWMENQSTSDGKPGSSEATITSAVASDLSASSSHQPNITTEERTAEVTPDAEKNDLDVESQAKEW